MPPRCELGCYPYFPGSSVQVMQVAGDSFQNPLPPEYFWQNGAVVHNNLRHRGVWPCRAFAASTSGLKLPVTASSSAATIAKSSSLMILTPASPDHRLPGAVGLHGRAAPLLRALLQPPLWVRRPSTPFADSGVPHSIGKAVTLIEVKLNHDEISLQSSQ